MFITKFINDTYMELKLKTTHEKERKQQQQQQQQHQQHLEDYFPTQAGQR
jgi:hypothetical protein